MSEEEATLRPDVEAAVHLIRAGRELLGAVRSVADGLDAYLEVLEQRMTSARRPASSVQAIPIDRASG